MRIMLSALAILATSGNALCQESGQKSTEFQYNCAVYTDKADIVYCELEKQKLAARRAESNLRMEEFKDSPDCETGEFWRSNMGSDPMTDEKTCSISPTVRSEEEGGLFTLIDSTGLHFTTIGEKYPGESSRIRIDKNQAITFESSISGERAKKLLAQLATGKKVLTEYRDWPYNLARFRSMPVCDLPQKIQSCRDFVK